MKSVFLVFLTIGVVISSMAQTRKGPTSNVPSGAIKPEMRMQMRYGTPPAGLKWHVIQPTDFSEERMYRPDQSNLHLFNVGSGPVMRLSRQGGNVVYGALAPVRLPDGVSIKWMECYVKDLQGSGDTSVTVHLYQYWLTEPSRNTVIANVRIKTPGNINDKIYRGFAKPQSPHQVDNANTYYVLRATFGSKTGRGQGLRACKIGYSQ